MRFTGLARPQGVSGGRAARETAEKHFRIFGRRIFEMEREAVLEHGRKKLIEDANANSSPGEHALHKRIEFLRELARSLLEQVESLEGASQPNALTRAVDFYAEVRRFETDIIRHALTRTGGNQTRAARLLGLKLTTLNTKIKRYHIQPA
jgi:DNA-binding NtrC family response regulator